MTKKIMKYLVFASLAFSGCFSPWKGNEATLTLLLGSPASRGVYPDNMVYTFDLEGPTGRKSITLREGAKQLSLTVTPGYWNISINGYLEKKLYAKGQGGAQIKAGRDNKVKIQMSLVTDIKINPDEKIELDFGNRLPNSYTGIIPIFASNPYNDFFTVTVKDDLNKFDSIEWRIGSVDTPLKGSGSRNETVTIYAKDYPSGQTYDLIVIVYTANGVPYSETIQFEVID